MIELKKFKIQKYALFEFPNLRRHSTALCLYWFACHYPLITYPTFSCVEVASWLGGTKYKLFLLGRIQTITGPAH